MIPFMKKHLLLALILGASTLKAAETSLAKAGQAMLPIVHATDASPILQKTAADVAALLGRMAGCQFAVEAGVEPRGIILGTVRQFPAAPNASKLDADDVLRGDEYIIHSDGQALWLIGATEAGASNAAWDFMHRLGYRLYFPGSHWEIVPQTPSLAMNVDVMESPTYKIRRFAWHFGTWSDLKDATVEWEIRNRVVPPQVFPNSFRLNTLHIYVGIIKRFQDVFEANPTMRSEVDGRLTGKLNPANPKTLEVVCEYANEFFEKNPEATSISMDPSDGGGWGITPAEKEIGTPSDRTVLIANTVAEYVNARFGQKYVGIYAYNEHSPAPTRVTVNPQVIVSFATSFIQGGFTVDELMQNWAAKGAKLLGIREYHSVVAWDLSRPGSGRAANLDYLRESIPRFNRLGAVFYTAEAGENWGSQGLGNYLTTRVLWNTGEAAHFDQLMEEFLTQCFPGAVDPMRVFYRKFLHPEKVPPLSADLIGRMYRTLGEAKSSATDPAVQRRLDELVLYTRYSELLSRYVDSRQGSLSADEQHAAMEEVIKFAYRIRHSRMVSSLAIYRDISNPRRNPSLRLVEDADWKKPEGDNPWKNPNPPTSEEIAAFLSEGIANNPLLDFEPIAFSRDLVPATPLLDAAPTELKQARDLSAKIRGDNQIFTWVEQPQEVITFQGEGGSVYTNKGNVTISLIPLDAQTGDQGAVGEGDEEAAPVFTKPDDIMEIPPDKEFRDISLKPASKGAYIIQTSDEAGGFRFRNWPASAFFTVESSLDKAFNIVSRTDFVFYVPKGTKTLGAFVRGKGTITDGRGRVQMELGGESRYISIPVTPENEGSFWRYQGLVGGRLLLLTVPAYMAPSPAQMMLPREVVEADRLGTQ